MAATYDDLKLELAAWLDRDDIDTAIPGFIESGEDWLNRGVIHFRREVEHVTGILAPEAYNLPNDFYDAIVVGRDGVNVTMLYRGKISRLAAGNQTNWLLDEDPTLYRLASLIQAEGYLKNDPRIEVWKVQAKEQLSALNARGAGVFPTPDKEQRRPVRLLPSPQTGYKRLQYVSTSEMVDMLGSGLTMAQNGGRQVWSLLAGQLRVAPDT